MNKLYIVLACITISSITGSLSAQDRWKTNVQRVNTEGITPPQPRYNFYLDKLNAFLTLNEWLGDEIVSIKEMKIMPPNDPSDWYYFVSVKTKKCSTPFILSYDIGDSNLGELFIIEPAGYPIEFQNELKKRVEAQKQSADDLAVAKEIYGKEAFKVFKEQVVPVIVPYRRNKSLKVMPRIEQTVDNLIDGYVQEDSTKLSKEGLRERLLNYLTQSDLYIYNVAKDTALTNETFDQFNIYSESFIDKYVIDRKNAVNNYLAQLKQDYDKQIENYFKTSEELEIAKIKENMWYKKIQYLKKEQAAQPK